MAAHSTFELIIQSTTVEGEYRLVAEWVRSGGLPVRVERSFELENDQELQAQTQALGYGEVLGRMLFTDGVRELFAQARAGTELRVLLAVEAKALQTLRWERLAAPFEDGKWVLLGHSQRTPFSLYLPSSSDRRFPPFGRRDLRALVVVANPEPGNSYGVEPFDEAEALSTVLEGLGEIPSTVLGKDPRAEGPPTLAEIGKRLTAGLYTLLHVVCHGAYSARTGETAVFLDGDDGKTQAVKATTLIRGLKDLGTVRGLPHFAFLGVCDSAKPEAEDSLGGLGQRLVRELGMPAVVAMTERVSQATAFALGKALYTRLRDHGEVDRALVEACVEVARHDDSVVPALFSRLAGRPLFSDDLDRPLTRAELAAAAEQLDGLFLARAPVLRERARKLAAAVTVDPAVLEGQAARDHAKHLSELEQLCEDVLEMSFSAVAHGREPPPYAVRCPFPGMMAFTAEQREFFRGRDALVEQLVQQLQHRPILAVLGNSGCGKSSLVMAGVVPQLQDARPGLELVSFKPGEHPLASLEDALGELEGVADAVLYVDQFEESFTLCLDQVERKTFFDRLLAVASPRRRVLLSMRADFIGECAAHKGLRAQVEGLKLIPPMSADELRNAIEEQGKAAGLRYETGLCELILEDLAQEPGAMPLLQHALQELYARRHGRWLRVEAYEALGRVQKAITQTAEKVWDRLDDQDRDRLCALMLELTEVREPEGGGPVRYLRRRIPLAHLYATTASTIAPWARYAAVSEEPALKRLIDVLADERLLVKSRDERLGDVVEVAHEALLRGWERLQDWLAAARDSIRLRQAMEAAATEWRNNDQSRAYLEHVNERAELVRSFLREGTLKLDPRLSEYFTACEAEEKRQRDEKERQQQEKLEAAHKLAREQTRRVKQLRKAAVIVSVVGAMAIVAAVASFVLFEQATKAEAKAVESAEVAKVAESSAVESAEQANVAKAEAEDALDRQHGVTAELMADQAGKRAEGLVRSILLSKPDPLHVDRLPIEVRRALFASTRELHHSIELEHAKGKSIVDIAFSPDGEQLATAGRDHTAKLWSVRTGELLATMEGHEGDVESVAFVPGSDGKQLLTVGREGTARLWGTDGRAVDFIEPVGRVVAASFSPDHRQVAVATNDDTGGALTLWTEQLGIRVATPMIAPLDSPVTQLAYLPAGRRALVVHKNGSVQLIDTSKPPFGSIALVGHRAAIRAAQISPDGTRIGTGDEAGQIRLWDAETGALRGTYQGTGTVEAIAFSPRGDRIAVALERVIELWDIDRDQKLATLRGHRAVVSDVTFSPDGLRVATVSWDKTLRQWSAETGAELAILEGHGDQIRHLAYSPDGHWIATAANDGVARLWSTHAGTRQTLLSGEGELVRSMAFAPDGSWIAMATATSVRMWNPSSGLYELGISGTTAMGASSDGTRLVTVDASHTPTLWDPRTAQRLADLPAQEVRVQSIAFSPDGTRLATGDLKGTTRLWDAGSHELIGEPIHAPPGYILALDFSPDGQRLVTGSLDVKRWDLANRDAPPAILQMGALVYAVVFSPDGKQIAAADGNGQVRLWSGQPGEAPVELSGHLAAVHSVDFSPEGRRLVTGGTDASVRLWDTQTGEQIFVVGTHAREVIHVRFADDGRSILSGSIDGVVEKWVIDPQQRMRFACEALQGIAVEAEAAEICASVLAAATAP